MTMRVMIAARDDWLLVPVRLYLQHSGYEVETVHDGLECVDKLEDNPPDALILEHGLLWGNADGVVACMREGEGPPPVPVVLIVDEYASEEPADLIDAPVVACLRKPFHRSELSACLLALSAHNTEASSQQSSRR